MCIWEILYRVFTKIDIKNVESNECEPMVTETLKRV